MTRINNHPDWGNVHKPCHQAFLGRRPVMKLPGWSGNIMVDFSLSIIELFMLYPSWIQQNPYTDHTFNDPESTHFIKPLHTHTHHAKSRWGRHLRPNERHLRVRLGPILVGG